MNISTDDGRTPRIRKPRPVRVETGETLIGLAEIAAILSVSPRTVERERAAGRLPKPAVVIGSRCLRWRREDIQAWIAGQSIARRR